MDSDLNAGGHESAVESAVPVAGLNLRATWGTPCSAVVRQIKPGLATALRRLMCKT
jgi:hypothetical protein